MTRDQRRVSKSEMECEDEAECQRERWGVKKRAGVRVKRVRV